MKCLSRLSLLCGRLAGIAKENDWDFITNVDPNNTFGELTNKTRQLGAGVLSFVKVVAIAGIMIVLAGLIIAISKDKNRRTEGSDWLIRLLFGALKVFLMVVIVSVIAAVVCNALLNGGRF